MNRIIFASLMLFSSLVPSTCSGNEEGCDSTKASLLVEKAKILLADQKQVEACDLFLQALRYAKAETQDVSSGEAAAFQALFPAYEASLRSAADCEQFMQQAEQQVQLHPEYVSLEFYVAAGLANSGRMDAFFDRFFHAYQYRKDSFLAWKTVGVLHLRLFEASAVEEIRASHRMEAVRCLQEAFRKQSQDGSLLVKLLFIMPSEEKRKFLESVVDDFVACAGPPKRSDCFFLIEQALDIGAKETAKKLIDKARIWYQYSRALSDLSERYEHGE